MAQDVEPAADGQHSEDERRAGVEPRRENFEIVAVSTRPVQSAVIEMILDEIDDVARGESTKSPLQGGREGNGRPDEKS